MKNRVYFIIHILIIFLELYAINRTIILNNRMGLEYYTVISNLLAFITSLLCLFYYKQNNKLVNNLYYLTTVMLTITFLIVFFVLAPMYDFKYNWLMFKGSNLMMHTLCPSLMINSYLFFNKGKNNKYLPLIITSIYGILMVILNLLKVVDGPYPFLKVYNQPLYISILWFIGILGFCYFISLIIIKLNKKLSR